MPQRHLRRTDKPMLREIEREGDRCLLIENGVIRVGIDLDCGAHIFEVVDLRSGDDVLYRDPAGIRDYRVGGWYELFPNAGPAGRIGDREFSRHGDLQHRRWEVERLVDTDGTVEITFTAQSAELPVRVTRTMRFGRRGRIAVRESIRNESDLHLSYLWGHHITFGAAMMGAGSRIEVPDLDFTAETTRAVDAPYPPGVRGRLDRFPGADGTPIDLTRFDHPPYSAMLFADVQDDARYAINSASLGLGVQVDWDREAFGALWLWASTAGTREDPELVACALEPQASVVPGLADASASGAAPRLAPRAQRSAWLNLEVAYLPAHGSSRRNGTERHAADGH